jgi:YD repeat-containing protein
MTKQLLTFIFVTSLLFQSEVFAQSTFNLQQPPVLPQSPNTATLGKFGDYQVSMFTGVPQIAIPLYTIKTSAFEVPITLAYHASGIRLYDFPGWAGSGWALSAGGEIRRKMVGAPDEVTSCYMDNVPPRAANISQSNSADYDSLKSLSQGSYDLGADIFSYSFPGGDGKFFFDRDSSYKPVLMPYAPVQVITHPRNDFRFDLRDAQGNFYQFGKQHQDFTSSVALNGNPNEQVSAWMLEKMISPTKADSITFSYQMQTDHTPWERSDTWVVSDLVSGGINNPYSASEGTFSSSYSQSYMYYCSQEEITFKNGRIAFELDSSDRQDFAQDNNSKRLMNIKVYAATPDGEQLIKTIKFFHSYFTDGADESKRLRLDSLQILDSSSVVINTYKFEYNTVINLPAVNNTTMCKDFWGYYNGKAYNLSTNNTLIPQTQVIYKPTLAAQTDTITIGSPTMGSREPDSIYMQAAILKRIYFPTGGYTDFEYETNRHLDDSDNVKLAGGLRVKSIKSYDGISAAPLVKTYKYGINESGVGRANYLLGEYYFYDEQEYQYYYSTVDIELMEYGWPSQQGIKRVRIYYSNPSIDIQSFDSPVVYPWVTEYIGQDSNTLGKTVYQFRDSIDGARMGSSSTKTEVITNHFERGQLLNKRVYKKTAAGVFQPLSEERNNYNTASFPMRNKFGGLLLEKNTVYESNNPGFQFGPTTIGNVGGNDYYFNDYYYVTNDNYPISSTSIVYDVDDSTKYVESVTTTDYANYIHQQPTSTTTINSKGDTVTIRMKYPADYISSGTSTGNVLLDTMLQRNMQVYAIEKWQTVTKPSQSPKVTAGMLTKYKQAPYNGIIVPDKQSSLILSSPITNFQVSSIGSGQLVNDSRYDTVINFNRYNNSGDIVEIQKSNDIKESYLWAYNGAYPVAKIVGASYDLVGQHIDTSALYSSVSSSYIQSQLSSLRSTFANSKVLITTLTYTPLLGVTSETDPSGKTVYYEYDGFGRLRRIKDRDGNILKVFDYKYQTSSNQ